MKELDDFPVTPGRAVDTRRFYEAFISAREIFSQVPNKARGADPQRALHDLTLHMYERGSQSDALFRASLGAKPALSSFWLSQVRSVAEWVLTSGDVPPYEQLHRNDLAQIARLSSEIGNIKALQSILYARGVILVYQEAIPGSRLDGCAFLLGPSRPVIALSLRYARVDYFWFTVMHELAHLCLHQDQLFTPIVDNLDEPETELVEIQANKLARDSLIPRNLWRNCPAKYSLSEADVVAFANHVGVAPEVVAGRLRKESHRHDLFNGLMHKVNVRELLNRDA